ncbi:MAG: hypothetical protein OXC95_05480 [Dehalococcoidia bacterium]|nr:hypothetical protein [Dehalococcoidia bacterium]
MKWWAVMTGVLGVAILLVLSVLAPFTRREFLVPSDVIQIVTLVVLVIVTAWYAYSTHRIHRATTDQVAAAKEQAEASRRAVEVALDTEKNTVLPIVKLEWRSSVGGDRVTVAFINIGRGPALNLRAWLRDNAETGKGNLKSNVISAYALGVGEQEPHEFRALPRTHLPNLSSGFSIVAEYSDIYEQSFRSTFYVVEDFRDRKSSFERIRERTA